eukprot:552049-Prymnesium_polylepis.1
MAMRGGSCSARRRCRRARATHRSPARVPVHAAAAAAAAATAAAAVRAVWPMRRRLRSRQTGSTRCT